MISETRMAYGSRLWRQGKSRLWWRNQTERARRKADLINLTSNAQIELPTSKPEKFDVRCLRFDVRCLQRMNSYTHPITVEQTEKLEGLLRGRGFTFAPKPYTIFFAQK